MPQHNFFSLSTHLFLQYHYHNPNFSLSSILSHWQSITSMKMDNSNCGNGIAELSFSLLSLLSHHSLFVPHAFIARCARAFTILCLIALVGILLMLMFPSQIWLFFYRRHLNPLLPLVVFWRIFVFTQTLSLCVTTSLAGLLNHYLLHPTVEGTCLSLH